MAIVSDRRGSGEMTTKGHEISNGPHGERRIGSARSRQEAMEIAKRKSPPGYDRYYVRSNRWARPGSPDKWGVYAAFDK